MTLLGIDVSHHQPGVNFASVKQAGNSFVFIKATEGTGYTDPAFHANVTAARGAGLTVGAYHFAAAGDPTSEADYFCSVVGALQPGDLVVLDWETTTANPPAWCKTWLDRVSSQLGVKPLIYMNQSTRNGFNWAPVIAGNYGLWLAAYDGNLTIPSPGAWPAVAIKQFTSNGTVPGVAGFCDRNVFFGDATALAKYGKQAPTPQPQPKPTPTPEVDMLADERAWLKDIHDRLTPGDAATGKPTGVAWAAMDTIQSGVAQLLARPTATVDAKAIAAAIVAALPADQAQQVAKLVVAGLNGARISTTPAA